MDLSTEYLGLKLPHPIMPGASPMVDDLGMVRQLEDAGAAAIVMHSLFEEQLTGEQMATHHTLDVHHGTSAEALSYLPQPEEFALGPHEYLAQIEKIKRAVDIPLIGSLNGVTPGGWTEHARLIEDAGADALELNIYAFETDPETPGHAVDRRLLELVSIVRKAVTIPLAVKLTPFYTSIPHLASKIAANGANGAVLFNRFYQPDIDIEELEVVRSLRLSDSSELLLRLRFLAALSGKVPLSLAISGGVHTPVDAIKAVMCGAHAVQMVSAILQRGPARIPEIVKGIAEWLEEHEYDSLEQMQGSMSLRTCPDPRSYDRTNYVRILQNWRGDGETEEKQ